MPRRQQPHQAPGAESTVALGQCFIGFAIVFEPFCGKSFRGQLFKNQLFSSLLNSLFSSLLKKQPLQFQPCVRRVLIRCLRGPPCHRQSLGGQSGCREPPGRSGRPFGWRFAARRGRR